jgi:hypothetical protein
MTTSSDLATDTLRGNFVLLVADGLSLLLPQHEVGAAEYLGDTLEAADEAGLFKLAGTADQRRFAALSAQMTLLPVFPSGRFLVTTLSGEDREISWCWNELRVLINVELPLHPLPQVMLAADTPVSHYVELDGKLAWPCNAKQMSAFALAERGVR